MLFETGLENGQFQMIMKTKWLLEHIAEQTMGRKRLLPDMRPVLDTGNPTIESKFHRNSSVL